MLNRTAKRNTWDLDILMFQVGRAIAIGTDANAYQVISGWMLVKVTLF
jgi:hypothetical protein